MAAAEPGEGEPCPAPGPVRVDRLERVLGARRQVAALPADVGLESPPVEVIGAFKSVAMMAMVIWLAQ